MKTVLKLDWCSHEAAKYAVEHWHYSRTLPMPPLNSIGVWENGDFIGCVLFARGANPYLGVPYGLTMYQCAELVRVALTKHRTQVSKIISIAIRMMQKQSSGIRLIVSFADTEQGHHGGIYQAGNWVYSGSTKTKTDFELNGKKLQRRAYTGKNFGGASMALPASAKKVVSPVKYRYLMPLDDEMRKQIEPLRKPYPKRAGSADGGTAGIQPVGDGSNPIPALSSLEVTT